MVILGIDEVGRGPLAGPLVVGAVILPENKNQLDWVAKLKDSKKLTPKKRLELSEIILKEAPACGLGWVKPAEIDTLGMSAALKLAARKAVKAVQEKHVKFTEVIIDGNLNFLSGTKLEPFVTTVIKGDDKIKEISAASIIAKVARDQYMINLSAKYPEYDFDHNMGYGTKKHLAAIDNCGITPEHRLSFEPCKSLVGFEPDKNLQGIKSELKTQKNTTGLGKTGEKEVKEFLENHGHQILAQNFKTKLCEIDIISTKDQKIYFTEVKTRKNADYGGGLAAINAQKLQKMKFGVDVFLKMQPTYKQFDPLLAVANVNGKFEVLDWIVLN